MTPQELKNSILQLAIQGKLVEQRAEEGTGKELLEKILAAEGAKGKGEKSHAKSAKSAKCSGSQFSPISDDEKPFDIPDSWEWVRLEFAANVIPSKEYQILESEVLSQGRFPVVSQSKEYSIGFTDNSNKVYCHSSPVIIFGDHTTEVKLVEFDFVVGADGVKIFAPERGVYEKFLFFVLRFYSRDLNKVGGYSRHYKFLKNKPIPLPPLAEQKRIVAKIEELLPLIDRYEKAWSRLESFNKSFPVDMQKSLLQMAIQGKLVEQRAEEGTGRELLKRIRAEKAKLIAERKIKKEKPLPLITDEENLFDIPDTWEWVRLGDLANKMTDGTHRTPRYVDAGIPFVSVKDMSSGYLNLENTKFITQQEHEELCLRCNPEKGDLLISKVGTTGVPAIVDTDVQFSLFVSVALMKFSHALLNVKYLYYLIYSPLVAGQAKINTKGVGNQNWVIDKIRNTVVPLPPLAEQKRIVAKIEELLPLCDRLK